MELHSTKGLSDDKFSRLSRSLVERAMAMRCEAYIAQVKHMLLMQTIMNMGVSKRHIATSNQQLREMDRVKTLFIAGMSHELNNPLTSIIGYSEMVTQGLAGPLSERQMKYMQNIITSAKHLQALVADAMDVAKIEANVIKVNLADFNLSEVVSEALAVVEQKAEAKGLVLKSSVDAGIGMHSDRQRLMQCLINLLTNAIKYTENGTVTIAATAGQEMVVIKVADTGIGLSGHDLQHLFEAFHRGGAAGRSKEKGSGIGLFLTDNLVRKALKGTITVESELERGTVFTLRLPQSLQ